MREFRQFSLDQPAYTALIAQEGARLLDSALKGEMGYCVLFENMHLADAYLDINKHIEKRIAADALSPATKKKHT
jgi:hypothetical protein